MTELTWTDALALQLPAMDDTHREFVDLLSIVARAADDTLIAAWAALIDHTDHHFGQEDRWMRETGFSSVNCHTTQHGVVLRVMREGLELGRAGRLDVIRQMAGELAQWFPQHAQTMDAALALHLRSVGFDAASGELARPELLPEAPISGCGSGSCSPAPAGQSG
ncbi:hemerythrin domain-containing protein [Caldimonas sp. KR1-144]|uniref:hemerythrin domain-containing protein n=1 Tax=Caldimonas sp. KR1-144 TaxID=3400911 RepID=UPI003C09BDD4